MKKKFSGGQLIIGVVLALWSLTTIYPILWVVLNSFKDKKHILVDSFSIPTGDLFTLENYRVAFERLDILGAYRNSILISLTVCVFVMIFAGRAAYVLSRYTFKGKNLVYGLVIAGMMFPVFSTIIPVYRMEYSWGIVNTDHILLSLISVALPQIAGNMSFAIVILMGFIKSIPIDLEEAAYMEGCKPNQIFYKVIVPMAKPSFATVGIFTFLWSYNDLFTQSFFLRGDQYVITRLLKELTSREGTNYGLMAAAVGLIVIPLIIVYILLQKQIVKGLTAGAVKG